MTAREIKHALVTGGTGFLGRHLVRRLIEQGSRVTVISRQAETLAPLLERHPKKLDGRVGGFADPALLADLPPLDTVFHLAAITDAAAGARLLEQVNVTDSRTLFEWARGREVGCFFAASSIEAQGPSTPDQAPLRETNPCDPVGPYGASKLAAEQALAEAAGGAATRLILARIGNVYGPGGPSFIRGLTRAITESSALISDSDRLEATRLQPLFVEELAERAVELVASPCAGLVNLVGPQTVSLADWLADIAELVGLSWPATGSAPMSPIELGLADYLFGAAPRTARVYSRERLQSHCPAPSRFDLLKGTAWSLAELPERRPAGAAR